MIKTYFLDNDNNITTEDKATHVIIQELDENGNLIKETFGFTENQVDNSSLEKEKHEFSPEINEILNNYTDGNGNYMFRK